MFGKDITQIAFMYVFRKAHNNSRGWAGRAQDPYFSGSNVCGGKVVGMKYQAQDHMAGKQQSQDSNPSLQIVVFFSAVQTIPMATLLNCSNSSE